MTRDLAMTSRITHNTSVGLQFSKRADVLLWFSLILDLNIGFTQRNDGRGMEGNQQDDCHSG